MTDNITELKRRLDEQITKELDEAIERHPAGKRRSDAAKASWDKRKKVEGQRAKRFSADTKVSLAILLVLTGIVAAASFSISFYGLYQAAAWGLGRTPLQFAVPVVLDVAIVAFTFSLFVEKSRGMKTAWTMLMILVLAGVSTYANALHALAVGTSHNEQELWFGVVISGGMPPLLALVTDKIGSLVFAEVER